MTNFTFYANRTLTLVCLPADQTARFGIEEAASLTGVHPEMLRYYVRAGLIDPCHGFLDAAPCFDDEALQEVRRIEYYRRHFGVGRRALPLICELRREGERRHIDLPFLQLVTTETARS